MTDDIQNLTLRIARDVLGLDAYFVANADGIKLVAAPNNCYIYLNDPAVIVQMMDFVSAWGDTNQPINTRPARQEWLEFYILDVFYQRDNRGEALARLCLAILEDER